MTPAPLPLGPLTTSLLSRMVQTGLPDVQGATPGLPLTVSFGDGSVQITPQRPAPTAAFTALFGDATLTITP
ncbi:hypothetical protein CEP88_20125 (plasmid) [Roseobacter denitrificans]|uniref:Uncharacterized protein n=1 Tax=Roseobacter denitrificans (strain ATCC 33942 / OCh 114) TaxID=375451 RepID=Q07GI8_ROSDO|nr:hypothetical protein [Roseobacter denitrificans]ABI93411.1 hypothetical protein RD1_B0002 [Roseobacter denitrificans OCh 114]AVL55113.1 hypothetical protein CEP88_20125 [Roseobacter denitrificans]SFG43901.1 hypothetical protein SAMN05443635_11813 [Roseobacter denitrificans OCh 114]